MRRKAAELGPISSAEREVEGETASTTIPSDFLLPPTPNNLSDGQEASPEHFQYMDLDAPRTKRIIDAALTVFTPWEAEDVPVYRPSNVAQLAERIDHRAKQGLTVHLRPETARVVASTMKLYSAGHPDLRESHPHHVEDWTDQHGPQQVLAYCTSATLAIGALTLLRVANDSRSNGSMKWLAKTAGIYIRTAVAIERAKVATNSPPKPPAVAAAPGP